MKDYKKKYEDALSWLKDIYPTFKGATKEDAEHYFPELKESEDERIRKELIDFLDDVWHLGKDANFDKYRKSDCADWIAWLEKQGEQKPQGKLALEVWKEDMRLEVYQQASGNRHEPNYSDDSTKMFSLTDIDEIFEKVAEKQGEQKTTNKVEPKFKVGDKIIHKELGGDFIHNPHKIIQVDMLDKKYRLEDGLVAHFSEEDDWELVEQNSAWSEEDKNAVKVLMNIIKKSEIIDSIIYTDSLKEKLFDWLKSLKERYTWKPSDEQIKALEDSIEFLGCTKKVREDLKSLYQDLKRLREE